MCLSKWSSIALLLSAVTACTNNEKPGNRPDFEASRIVERMEGFEKTPEYATGAKVMWGEGKQVYFANIMSLSGDSRPDACLKAAGIEAKAEMLKYIKESMTTSGQLSDDAVQEDPAMESLTAFISQGNISGAAIADRYWDRREESDSTGDRILRVRCAVKVAIDKGLLAKQLREATTKTKEGNPEIREKLLEAQKSFLENVGGETAL